MTNLIAKLRKPSFRGIAFELPDEESTFGRRIVTHEFPGSDIAQQEDMAKAPQVFSINVLVNGADFISRARALDEALTTEGAGTLVHPLYGALQVVVKNVRRSTSFEETGNVYFSFDCERSAAMQFPSMAQDTVAGLDVSASGLLAAVKGEFEAAFTSGSIPDFLSSDALGRISDFIDNIQDVVTGLNFQSLLDVVWPEINSLTGGLADTIMGLFDNLGSNATPKAKPIIGNDPVTNITGEQVTTLLTTLTDVSGYSALDTDPPPTTSGGIRQRNALALDNLFTGTTLAAVASLARFADYDSKEHAIATRDYIVDSILDWQEQLGQTGGWDESWKASSTVAAAITRDINDRIGRLPRTQAARLSQVRSSLNLANRFYGEDPKAIFDNAADIVKRNGVRHPGFIPAEEIEVLLS